MQSSQGTSKWEWQAGTHHGDIVKVSGCLIPWVSKCSLTSSSSQNIWQMVQCCNRYRRRLWATSGGTPRLLTSPRFLTHPCAEQPRHPLNPSVVWRPDTDIFLEPLTLLCAFIHGIRPTCQHNAIVSSVSPKNTLNCSQLFLTNETCLALHRTNQSRRKCVHYWPLIAVK